MACETWSCSHQMAHLGLALRFWSVGNFSLPTVPKAHLRQPALQEFCRDAEAPESQFVVRARGPGRPFSDHSVPPSFCWDIS